MARFAGLIATRRTARASHRPTCGKAWPPAANAFSRRRMAFWPRRSSRETAFTSGTWAGGSMHWTGQPGPSDGESTRGERTFPGRIRSTCSWHRRSWRMGRSSRPAARSSSLWPPRRFIAEVMAAGSCWHSSRRQGASSGSTTWARSRRGSTRRSRSGIAGGRTPFITGRGRARFGARRRLTPRPGRSFSAPT